jgi:pyruvate formate lyase activating enzyme
MRTKCPICPRGCALENGQTGFCKGRENREGKVICANYGKLTSIALDPIEKKPLSRFMPRSKILSVGSYGCNLRCPFCQNHRISMSGREIVTMETTPEELAQKALELKNEGNIGVAYTYNEPLIGYEFVHDCSLEVRKRGLKNVLVTNGYICEEPLIELLPHIDAMNIDLKSFSESFYSKLDGDLESVKRTIALARKSCHVEITTLIIPGENDSEAEVEQISSWLSSLDPNIPLHISRFFPRHKWTHLPPTPQDAIHSLVKIASRKLAYVYAGNI